MTRQELLDLFTPIYDEFSMIAAQGVSVTHPQVADVVTDPTKEFKFNAISGLGIWEEVDEDSDEGLDHFVIGYEGSVSPLKYRKYFYVTYEVNDQMEYAALKSKIVKAEALGRGGPARLEKLVADLLTNGFSAVGADSEIIFSTSHPKNPEETGIIYDNLLDGPFSHDNLELAEKQISANFYDLDGLPMVTYAGKPIIVHGSALRGQVGRVISERAGNQPDTTVRNINLYNGKYMAYEWAWLDLVLGGSDTQWFIIYPGLKNIKLIKNSASPQYASWIDNLKQRFYFDGWQHSVGGIEDWRGLWGSTGL